MSGNLYDILGVQRDATDDQIRKAYKKRALQTHPDRVPEEQKATAGEEFRKVNNAYEVLIDPSKRRAYDAAGVWPPPPPGSGGSRHRHRPHYSSREHVPFPEDPFDFGWHHTSFTDPYRLFEAIFGELRNPMADPFFPDPWHRGRRHDAHRQRGRSFFDDPLTGMDFPFEHGFDDMAHPGPSRTRVYSQVSRGSVTPDGRWVAESRMTRTVNGVTESVWKRKDGTGNEYATYTYPDGRERHTVNGREQIPPKQHVPSQRIQHSPPPPPPPPMQPPPPSTQLPPPPIQTTSLPPPPPYSHISRKRDSPTTPVSGRKRDSPSREPHSPIEIQSSSHAGSPPPIKHRYRSPPPPPPPPPSARDYAYAHETPHYKSRWWKR